MHFPPRLGRTAFNNIRVHGDGGITYAGSDALARQRCITGPRSASGCRISSQKEDLGIAVTGMPTGIILYDGICVLCNGLVRFVVRHDPNAYFAFAQLQTRTGEEIRKRCGNFSTFPDSIVLLEDGQCYWQSEAVFRILQRLSVPWNMVSVLRILPRQISDAIYRLVARSRYRIFGRYDECSVPPPSVRERLIS